MSHPFRPFRLAAMLAVLMLAAAACGPDERRNDDPDGGDDGDASVTPPPEVSASPAGGTHEGALVVTLDADRAATIRWTLDGSDPETSDTAQSGPSPRTVLIEPTATVELRFQAVDGDLKSEVVTETYTVLERLNPASISGSVVVHPKLTTGRVMLGLFTEDPFVEDFDGTPVDALFLNVGTNGSLPYEFEGLVAGEYWIAALWWPTNPPDGDPQAFAAPLGNPIALDPSAAGKKRADFVDVYLGHCDPGVTAGIHGTVEIPAPLLGTVTAVLAYDKPLTLSTGSTDPVAGAAALGSGAERPYALCDLEPDSLYLYGATLTDSGPPTDIVAWSGNPTVISGLHTATINLGVPDPSRGSVSVIFDAGQVLGAGEELRAVLAKGTSTEAETPLQAMKALPNIGSSKFPFQFTGLEEGSYRLSIMLLVDGQPSGLPVHDEPVEIAFPNSKDVQLDLSVD